jgi:peptide/nickel transport system substrate-binding protein
LTVEVDLATPLAGFLQLATQPIAPAHLLEGIAPADLPTDPFGQSPVGSGAFRLTSLDATKATLEPVAGSVVAQVPDGSGGGGVPIFTTPRPTDSLATPAPTAPPDEPIPYLPGIELRFFDTPDALRSAWDLGILDAASGLSPADAIALAGSPGTRLLRYPGTTLLAVDLDLRATQVLFKDPAVRAALLEAIDRDSIVSTVLAGLGTRADSLVPPTSPFAGASAPRVLAYDPAAAKAALRKAGWKQSAGGWTPKGAKGPVTIEVLCPTLAANPVAFAAAEAVVLGWQGIGLDATLSPLPAAELLGNRLRPGGFEAAVLPLAIGLDPDLYPLLASTQTRTGGSNVTGLQDPTLDKVLAAARAPGPDPTRMAAWKALEARLDAGEYILPLAFRDEFVVLRNTVDGPTPRPVGASGDRFWDVLTWRLLVGR